MAVAARNNHLQLASNQPRPSALQPPKRSSPSVSLWTIRRSRHRGTSSWMAVLLYRSLLQKASRSKFLREISTRRGAGTSTTTVVGSGQRADWWCGVIRASRSARHWTVRSVSIGERSPTWYQGALSGSNAHRRHHSGWRSSVGTSRTPRAASPSTYESVTGRRCRFTFRWARHASKGRELPLRDEPGRQP